MIYLPEGFCFRNEEANSSEEGVGGKILLIGSGNQRDSSPE